MASIPRRTRRGEERDAQLRAHASEMFFERGYDGVSIDDIVREVGGSKTNVYSFYGGKDGLFLAVMDEMITDFLLPLTQLQLDGVSLEDGLRKIATTVLGIILHERHLAFQRLVIAEALRHPQLGLSWYRHGPATAHAVLARFLASQQALGRIKPDITPARAAVLFHDMLVFDLLNRAMMAIDGGPTPDEIATTVDQSVRVITAALAGRATAVA
jgi:AcrR family transcriptional regulator